MVFTITCIIIERKTKQNTISLLSTIVTFYFISSKFCFSFLSVMLNTGKILLHPTSGTHFQEINLAS